MAGMPLDMVTLLQQKLQQGMMPGGWGAPSANPAGFATGQYSLPQIPMGMTPQSPAGLDPAAQLALLKALQGEGGGSLFSQYLGEVPQPTTPERPRFDPIQMPNPMEEPPQSSVSAGGPPGALGGDIDFSKWFTGAGWDQLVKNATIPGEAGNNPIPRGPQNSPAGNIGAGIFNNTVNSPAAAWEMYNQFLIDPIVRPAVGAAGDFLFKSEADQQLERDKAARVAAAEAPIPGKWMPPNTIGGTPVPAGAPGETAATTSSGLPLPQPLTGAGGGAPGPMDSYVANIIQKESGGSTTAKNPLSSAYGPGQFIKSTWLEFINERHPELARRNDTGKLLALRSDMGMNQEAIAWYAQKGVDVLDSLDMPVTDANLRLHHFLGTGGLRSLLSANPTDLVKNVLEPGQIKANPTVLGGNRTVQDVLDWGHAQAGDYGGRPPSPRPVQTMPDMTATYDWLDKAAPSQIPASDIQQFKLQAMLAEIGKGLGSVNAGQEGGGALFGALAGGAGQGAAIGTKYGIEAEQAYRDALAAYAGNRATVEQGIAGTQAGLDNANAQNAWQDQNDMGSWLEGQQTEAEQRAAAAAQAGIPDISITGNHLLVKYPDGRSYIQNLAEDNPWDNMKKAGDSLGLDDPVFQRMKYQTMMSDPTTPVPMVQNQIMRDIVESAQGPSVFGQDVYAKAVKAAEEQVPASLMSKPEEYVKLINKYVAANLYAAFAQAGDSSWLYAAADKGNPGAIMLLQMAQTQQQLQTQAPN